MSIKGLIVRIGRAAARRGLRAAGISLSGYWRRICENSAGKTTEPACLVNLENPLPGASGSEDSGGRHSARAQSGPAPAGVSPSFVPFARPKDGEASISPTAPLGSCRAACPEPHLRAIVETHLSGWTDAEGSHLDRLKEHLLALGGSLECGSSDEGEPWCVITSPATGLDLCHVARIQNAYVVYWPQSGVSVRRGSLDLVVPTVLEGVTPQLNPSLPHPLQFRH